MEPAAGTDGWKDGRREGGGLWGRAAGRMLSRRGRAARDDSASGSCPGRGYRAGAVSAGESRWVPGRAADAHKKR